MNVQEVHVLNTEGFSGDLEKWVRDTTILSVFKLVPMIKACKFGANPLNC